MFLVANKLRDIRVPEEKQQAVALGVKSTMVLASPRGVNGKKGQ